MNVRSLAAKSLSVSLVRQAVKLGGLSRSVGRTVAPCLNRNADWEGWNAKAGRDAVFKGFQ